MGYREIQFPSVDTNSNQGTPSQGVSSVGQGERIRTIAT
jgi:hypothetical protein